MAADRRREPRQRAGGSPPLGSRGMSLVELLVGMAIGLFIVATGLTLLTGNLRENRALLVESRLLQDLRTASDLVARDLRRAGYWADAGAGIRQAASGPLANPYAAVAPAGAASDGASFRFSRDAVENHSVDGNEQFGFRLRGGALELMLGNGNWQAVTDTTTLLVSRFVVTPLVQTIALDAFCAAPCGAGGSGACPTQRVRSLGFSLTARAAADAGVVRTVRQVVRLRNDNVEGACPP